ncbi:MAG TPA: GNAT family N-acetyltransferase [Chloroflexia bacterium]
MELRRFQSVEEYYAKVEPFLLEREAEHNLILGICANLMRYPERIEHQPYLAYVEQRGEIVAVAFMGPPNNFVLSHVAATEAIPLIASDLYSEHKTIPGVVASVPFSREFAEEWQRVSGQPYRLSMAERVYQLEKVNPVTGVPGNIRHAGKGDKNLLRKWFAEFREEALGETDTSRLDLLLDRFLDSETQGLYLWDNEQPVSMAGYNRPTPNGMVVAPVYTPREHRGKGYASASVAALSQALLDQGRKYCFLYTDLANPTSNHIYQAIGYEPVCDADMYTFGV